MLCSHAPPNGSTAQLQKRMFVMTLRGSRPRWVSVSQSVSDGHQNWSSTGSCARSRSPDSCTRLGSGVSVRDGRWREEGNSISRYTDATNTRWPHISFSISSARGIKVQNGIMTGYYCDQTLTCVWYKRFMCVRVCVSCVCCIWRDAASKATRQNNDAPVIINETKLDPLQRLIKY